MLPGLIESGTEPNIQINALVLKHAPTYAGILLYRLYRDRGGTLDKAGSLGSSAGASKWPD